MRYQTGIERGENWSFIVRKQVGIASARSPDGSVVDIPRPCPARATQPSVQANRHKAADLAISVLLNSGLELSGEWFVLGADRSQRTVEQVGQLSLVSDA